jgi:hypothetical protein
VAGTILARAVGAGDADELTAEVSALMAQTRRLFDRVVDRVRTETALEGPVERHHST